MLLQNFPFSLLWSVSVMQHVSNCSNMHNQTLTAYTWKRIATHNHKYLQDKMLLLKNLPRWRISCFLSASMIITYMLRVNLQFRNREAYFKVSIRGMCTRLARNFAQKRKSIHDGLRKMTWGPALSPSISSVGNIKHPPTPSITRSPSSLPLQSRLQNWKHSILGRPEL